MLPSMAVVLAVTLRWVRDPALMIMLGVVALSISFVLHVWAVPLIRTQLTDPRAGARARGQDQGDQPPR